MSHTSNESVDYTPITAWGYFGYELLFSLPIIGWIILIILAIVAKNRNLRSFARSYFCFLVVILVAFLLTASSGALSSILNAISSR